MRDPGETARACRQLWGEVLLMGLQDARRGRGVEWLGTREYLTVACLAGLDLGCARTLAERVRAEVRAAETAGDGPRQMGLGL